MIKIEGNFDTAEEKLYFQDIITKHFKIDIKRNYFNHEGKSFLRVHLKPIKENGCSQESKNMV